MISISSGVNFVGLRRIVCGISSLPISWSTPSAVAKISSLLRPSACALQTPRPVCSDSTYQGLFVRALRPMRQSSNTSHRVRSRACLHRPSILLRMLSPKNVAARTTTLHLSEPRLDQPWLWCIDDRHNPNWADRVNSTSDRRLRREYRLRGVYSCFGQSASLTRSA